MSSTTTTRPNRDWEEFYKAHSCEVIVIDDSPPPGQAPGPPPQHQQAGTGNSVRQGRYPQPGGMVVTRKRKYASPAAYRVPSAQANGVTLRGEKRRRKDSDEYRPPTVPVVKAKDVYVQTISDVSLPSGHRANSKNVYGKQKFDDEEGHYIIIPDTDITPRYKITRLLGQGTFGKVVMAFDRTAGTYCAIKIIRAVQKYRDASKIELRVLSTLGSNDPHNQNKCIHLRDCFDWRNHICIVTDLLGMSVFDFLKAGSFVGFPLSHIQSFAKQLFRSVAFLHDLKLIHTDLKPENILLVDSKFDVVPCSKRGVKTRRLLWNTDIRLIDFGSATFQEEYHSSIVSTRHYRAPEIILGLGWSFPCDIWSIGCILIEFYSGDALFQTHDNLEHLAMMEVVCGSRFDSKITRQVKKDAAKYFRSGRLDYPNAETSRTSRRFVKAMKTLRELINPVSPIQYAFLDLLQRIFIYDPKQRITAKEALDHPFLTLDVEDEGTEVRRRHLAELKS